MHDASSPSDRPSAAGISLELPFAAPGGTGRDTLRPLVPRGPLPRTPCSLSRASTSLTNMAKQSAAAHIQVARRSRGLDDPTINHETPFLNLATPEDIRSRESRRFVRIQVMRNFTREKRRRAAQAARIDVSHASSMQLDGQQTLEVKSIDPGETLAYASFLSRGVNICTQSILTKAIRETHVSGAAQHPSLYVHQHGNRMSSGVLRADYRIVLQPLGPFP